MRTPTPDVPGYALRERVVSGAHATVWRAEQIGSPGRLVAVRLIDDPAPAAARTIEREAAVLAELSHPNILRVLDVVTFPDGIALVTAFVTGGSLAARLTATAGGLEPLEVCETGARLASALAAAHDAGLVHRDVRPANVWFDREDQPLLTDFATAGASGDVDGAVGRTGYLDPDVAGDQAPDAAADIYALGITLYECLTGTLPYAGVTAGQTLAAADRGAHVRLDAHASLPRAVAAVVEQTMARDRTLRPVSASAIADDLDELARTLRAGPGPPPPRRPAGRAGVLGARPDGDGGDRPGQRSSLRRRRNRSPTSAPLQEPAMSVRRTQAASVPEGVTARRRLDTAGRAPDAPSRPATGPATRRAVRPRALIVTAIAAVSIPIGIAITGVHGDEVATTSLQSLDAAHREHDVSADTDAATGSTDHTDAATGSTDHTDAATGSTDHADGPDVEQSHAERAGDPPREPAPLCGGITPSVETSGLLRADIDGRGCSVLVAWDGGELQFRDADGESARFRLGAETDDVLLFGDWSCDGRDAPALYRPDDGQVFRFDALVDAEPVTVTGVPAGVINGVPTVRTDADGCDRIEVAPGP